MAYSHQATSHYLNQYWIRSITPSPDMVSPGHNEWAHQDLVQVSMHFLCKCTHTTSFQMASNISMTCIQSNHRIEGNLDEIAKYLQLLYSWILSLLKFRNVFSIYEEFHPMGLNQNKSALLQLIAWSLRGNKPLPEPMVIKCYDGIYAIIALDYHWFRQWCHIWHH